MLVEHWRSVVVATSLPSDAKLLVEQSGYIVVASQTEQTVYRIGVVGESSFGLSPSDIQYSHVLAAKLAAAGLNVLKPLQHHPRSMGRYVVSEFPLARPILEQLWTTAEAMALGRDLRAWEQFRDRRLADLDIYAYAKQRAEHAASRDGELADAGSWCLTLLEKLNVNYPFHELRERNPGTIHGDIHPGNLVRYKSSSLLLIDLDSVKRGPALFDIAVALLYQRRFNREYPGEIIAEGYHQGAPCNSEQKEQLRVLQLWKEASSYSQLLLRWDQGSHITQEFWRRTMLPWEGAWRNVVGTPTHSVLIP